MNEEGSLKTMSATEERKLKAKEAMDDFIKQQEEKRARAQKPMADGAMANERATSSQQGTKRMSEEITASSASHEEETAKRRKEQERERQQEENMTEDQRQAYRVHLTISRILNAGFSEAGSQSLRSVLPDSSFIANGS